MSRKGKGKKKGKQSQSKVATSEAFLDSSPDLDGFALTPFGQEIYSPLDQLPEDGDFIRNSKGEVVYIFEFEQWNRVEKHDSGTYVVVDSEYAPFDFPTVDEIEGDFGEGASSLLDSPAPPKLTTKGYDAGKRAYEAYENEKVQARLIVKGVGEVYETKRKLIAEALKKNFPHLLNKKDGVPEFTIPIDKLSFTEHNPSVEMCGYDATERYVEHMLGRGLDYTDANFYRRHALTDSKGIGLSDIPSVLQELLEPYGIGISRLRFTPGTYSPLADRDIWMLALGENPLGLSNEEFAEQAGQDVRAVNQHFRIDYAVEPLAPSVLALEGLATSGGGHIVYQPPRGGKRAGWAMSIQFDFLSNINYSTPIVIPNRGVKSSAYSLEWEDIENEKGDKIIPPAPVVSSVGSYRHYHGGRSYGLGLE